MVLAAECSGSITQGLQRPIPDVKEVFSGPLAPLITKAIPDMTRSFGMFAEGHKSAADGRA